MILVQQCCSLAGTGSALLCRIFLQNTCINILTTCGCFSRQIQTSYNNRGHILLEGKRTLRLQKCLLIYYNLFPLALKGNYKMSLALFFFFSFLLVVKTKNRVIGVSHVLEKSLKVYANFSWYIYFSVSDFQHNFYPKTVRLSQLRTGHFQCESFVN